VLKVLVRSTLVVLIVVNTAIAMHDVLYNNYM